MSSISLKTDDDDAVPVNVGSPLIDRARSLASDDDERDGFLNDSNARKKIDPETSRPFKMNHPPNKAVDFFYNKCVQYVPGWSDVRRDEFDLSVLNGGLTNQLYLAKCLSLEKHGVRDASVIIRIFGSDSHIFFDRETEKRVCNYLSSIGCGVTVFCSFSEFGSGRIEQFIHGRTLGVRDIGVPKMSRMVARAMARIHRLDVPLPHEPVLFNNLHSWYKYSAQACVAQRVVNPYNDAEFFPILPLEDEIDFLDAKLHQFKSPIVFCHNDMQEGNMIHDEASGLLHIIDFEYSSYNYRGFDIANHFCEVYIDNAHPEPPKFKLDIAYFPSDEHMQGFCRAYLEVFLGRKPTQEEIDALVEESKWFMLASHFQWAVWGVVQSCNSDIPFGYDAYAYARLAEYQRLKRLLLSV